MDFLAGGYCQNFIKPREKKIYGTFRERERERDAKFEITLGWMR